MTLNIRVTDDQLGQYYRRMTAIADRLGKSLPFDAVMSELQRIHDGQFENSMVGKSPVLRLANDNVAWSRLEKFNPQKYFRERAGLHVSQEFGRLVASESSSVTLEGLAGKSYDLVKNAYDRQIVPELGGGYRFVGASEVFVCVAQMIVAQPDGITGELLNNGYDNLFYFGAGVVHICWNVDTRCWCARNWPFDFAFIAAGCRVFARS